MFAMILKFLPLVMQLVPHLPDVFNMVHQVAGPTQGNGGAKLNAAVTLAGQVVPELEDAFNASPSVRMIVSGVMSLAYDIMKAQGSITGDVNPTSPVMAAQRPAIPVPATSESAV